MWYVKVCDEKTKKVCFAFSFTKITIKSLLNIPSVLRLHYIACYNVIMIGSYNYSCSKGQTARLFFFHLPLGCRWEPFYQEKYIISNFSCRFLSPNIFFPIWILIVLIYWSCETSSKNLRKYSLSKNCCSKKIVLVIWNFLQLLGLQPRISWYFVTIIVLTYCEKQLF